MRIMVGLSGGVDSAVAAARLVEQGHDVTAVHYSFARAPRPEDYADPQAVADVLGIELQVWDFHDEFAAGVMEFFTAEYAAGRTPNPCVRCNSTMKFGRVLERGLEAGFEGVATGHYARVDRSTGEVRLLRGIDPTKDQSYVLAVLRPDQLAHAYFPLGGDTKRQVREEASRRGLPVATKPDSLDICFIPDGDTAGFLGRRLGVSSGVVLDTTGAEVGTHSGSHSYTIGQRKGLRLGRPAADGRPRYVVATSPTDNTVTVGPREALQVRSIDCGPVSWTRVPHSDGVRCFVQVRAHSEPMPARVVPDGDTTRVELDAPAYGIAPGQAAVFYDGDEAIGMALIAATSA